MWRATVITLFPEFFPGPLGHRMAGRALKNGLWSLDVCPMRPYGVGRHHTVDGPPVGGGPGMVLRPDVVAASLDSILHQENAHGPRPCFLLSPRGLRLTQEHVRNCIQKPGIILICGSFEGVDERLMEARPVTEISVGDYILSSGEIGAITFLDACVRLIPGVMGSPLSHENESFEHGYLEHPHYTLPRHWEGHAIPDILFSGNHKEIADWRQKESERITRQRRPDLLKSTAIKGCQSISEQD